MKYSEYLLSDYIICDLETTGLSPGSDEIIEIAAVRVVNDVIADTFSTLVKPSRRISPYITSINGINNEMVKDAPDINTAMEGFLRFIGNMPVGGHNYLAFDREFLMRQADIRNLSFDTLTLARGLKINIPSKSLGSLCGYFHVKNETAHRALSDCKATHGVYQALKKYFSERGVFFSVTASCGKQEYQENIEKHCRERTVLTAKREEKTGNVLLYAENSPVGYISAKKHDMADNLPYARITAAEITKSEKGKYGMKLTVRLKGNT